MMAHSTARHPIQRLRLSLLPLIWLISLVLSPHFARDAAAQSNLQQTVAEQMAADNRQLDAGQYEIVAVDTLKIQSDNHTPTDAAHAVIRIETRRGDYVDFWETEPSRRSGHGSGFIVDPTGIAVTNNHVVTGATILKVYIGDDDTEFSARVLGVNECADLAVIQIQGNDFPYVEWSPEAIERRLPVEAIGFPLDAAEATFTQGIVSSTQANGQSPWSSLPQVLLHSAVINPGSSGGPLVDEQGRVVGINYQGSSDSNRYFAISRDNALPIVEQLRQGVDVDAIGINGAAFAQENGATGIWVYSVKPGSPADKAGIQAGDILASLGGVPMGSDGTMQGYCEVVRSHSATDTINVEVYRLSEQATCNGQLNGRTLQCAATASGTSTADSPSYSYRQLSVDDGAVILEKPRDWEETDVTLWKQEDEAIGLRVVTAPDVEKFHTTWNHTGLSLQVSTRLGGRISPDELLDQTSFGRTCTYVTRQAFTQNRYRGQLEAWANCGGAAENMLFLAAFAPADESFIALLIFQTTNSDELEIADHLINTLTVDPAAMRRALATTDIPTPVPTRQPQPTATPQPVSATVLVETLNVRTGPGTNYALLAAAKRDQTFAVIGQYDNCAWVLIQDSSGQKGWIAAGDRYARVNGGCTVPSSTEILPAPAAVGGGTTPVRPPQPSSDGCITFQNQLNAELTITFTGQRGQGSRDFRVAAHGAHRHCFTPGPYTYTLDAPPPWGSTNGSLDVTPGMNIAFPIGARD